MGRFIFVSIFVSFFLLWEDFSDGTPVSLSLSGSTSILPWFLSTSVSVCLYMCLCIGTNNSLQYCLFSISLPLSPHSTAFVLHSIIPLLQSGVEKRESGNFIIITSHFCNLYAMRTLRACSYNQVCRNHVRCFTNSWGNGSTSGGYGFPCC